MIRERLEGRRAARAGQQRRDFPKAEGGGRLGSIDTDIDTWSHVFRVNFLRRS